MPHLRSEPPTLLCEVGTVATTQWGEVRIVRTTTPFTFLEVRGPRAYAVLPTDPRWSGPPVAMVVSYFATRPTWQEVHLVHAHPDFARREGLLHPAPVEVGRWLFAQGHLTHHAAERTPEHDEWAHDVGGVAPHLDPNESLIRDGERALELLGRMAPPLPHEQTWRLVQTGVLPGQSEYDFAIREGEADRGRLQLMACAQCRLGMILKVQVEARRGGIGRAVIAATRHGLPGLTWYTNNQLEGSVPFWQAMSRESGQPYKQRLDSPRCPHGGPQRSPLDGWILTPPPAAEAAAPAADDASAHPPVAVAAATAHAAGSAAAGRAGAAPRPASALRGGRVFGSLRALP